MSNHKVVQKLFNIRPKDNIGSQQLTFSQPKRSIPVDTQEEMFIYLLTRQKEQYDKLLESHGVEKKEKKKERGQLREVALFLAELRQSGNRLSHRG